MKKIIYVTENGERFAFTTAATVINDIHILTAGLLRFCFEGCVMQGSKVYAKRVTLSYV